MNYNLVYILHGRKLHVSYMLRGIRIIIDETQLYDHKVVKIGSMKLRITKAPLHLFLIELKRKSNNYKLYIIKFIKRIKVAI